MSRPQDLPPEGGRNIVASFRYRGRLEFGRNQRCVDRPAIRMCEENFMQPNGNLVRRCRCGRKKESGFEGEQ